MTSLSLLSIDLNGLGYGRGLNMLQLGRSARLICISHPTGWMMGCINQNMLNSYNRLNNRLYNRLFNRLDNRLDNRDIVYNK